MECDVIWYNKITNKNKITILPQIKKPTFLDKKSEIKKYRFIKKHSSWERSDNRTKEVFVDFSCLRQ